MAVLPDDLRRRVPVGLRRALRAARASGWSVADRLWSPEALIGPGHAGLVGRGDLDEVGREFLGLFQQLGGLTPDSRVLDIGCGVGRMAAPLTTVLVGGSYDGFDVTRHTIASCQRRITSRYPRFRFQFVDVANDKFNPRGSIPAELFRFPYDDHAFDLVFATSVFTHMREGDVRHYLGQIARVLAPGGCALLTWFALGPDDHEGVGGFHPLDHSAWTLDPQEPEAAIAFPEGSIRSWCADAGLAVREPLHRGTWRGGPGLSFQDVLVVAV